MKERAYMDVVVPFDKAIRDQKAKIIRLEALKDMVLNQLEKECIEQHGSHLDDGGMFHGFCIRCGCCLG